MRPPSASIFVGPREKSIREEPTASVGGTHAAARSLDASDRADQDRKALPDWVSSAVFRPARLAHNLAHGAMLELRLTPKPGLVDLRSNGSHPDLNLTLMTRSASLLPAYFRELLEAERGRRRFEACIEAGRRAEARMRFAVGSNAHRGLIFLGGLLLLASCRESEVRGPEDRGGRGARLDGLARDGFSIGELRLNCAIVAEEYFRLESARNTSPSLLGQETNGACARRKHSVGGIRAESLSGLPSVFEVGLPAFLKHLEKTGDFVLASHYAVSRLMQAVEDTTALHRCGPAGLARIRHDGGILQRVLEEEGDHLSLLERWDAEYTEMNLTMGGVADCLGLTYAVYLTAAGTTETDIGDLQALFLQRRHGPEHRTV